MSFLEEFFLCNAMILLGHFLAQEMFSFCTSLFVASIVYTIPVFSYGIQVMYVFDDCSHLYLSFSPS